MSANKSIEWSESTWNPVTGCTNISTGFNNCYAEKMSYRLRAMGQEKYQNGFKVTSHPELLSKPF
jgi:protein gp37